VVGKASRLRTGWVRVVNPVVGDFVFSRHVRTSDGFHPASGSVGTGRLFPGKAVEAFIEFENEWSFTSTLLRVVYGTAVTFQIRIRCRKRQWKVGIALTRLHGATTQKTAI
jgi:hypothetical protein